MSPVLIEGLSDVDVLPPVLELMLMSVVEAWRGEVIEKNEIIKKNKSIEIEINLGKELDST